MWDTDLKTEDSMGRIKNFLFISEMSIPKYPEDNLHQPTT